MDYLIAFACGAFGALLALGLAFVFASWGHNRRMPKCPVPEDINPYSR
jgi:hypothetical protein